MDINSVLKDADMVLIGIGETFQEKFENIKVKDEKNVTIFEDFEKKYKRHEEMIQNFIDADTLDDAFKWMQKVDKFEEGI